MEEAPAEEAPAEEAPDEEAPVEEAPAEEPAAEESPVEEPAAEEAPAEEAPVEEAPAEEAPAEEAPIEEEAPAEEAPAAEESPSAEEAPASEEAPAADEEPAVEDEIPADAETPAEGEVLPEGEEQDETAPVESDDTAAQDPATEEPVTLDVEGGAPVLDSAKEPQPTEAEAAVEGEATAEGEASPAADPEEVERLQRRIERLETERGRRPTSDAEAQAIAREFAEPVEIESITIEEGTRVEAAPQFEQPQNVTIINQTENRYVYEVNNQIIVESSDRERLVVDAQEVYYEELPRGRYREVVVRPNGAQIITVRNRYGDVIRRSRIRPSGEEVLLVYAPEYDTEERYVYRDPAVYLPPLELTIPVDEYIYNSTRADDYTDYVTFFEQPPIEPLVETYSIEEVKRSARVRDIMPRVDLSNITFEFGSASISESQVPALEEVANAMLAMLEEDDSEIFLLEGHTDAVGSDQANLILSDQRAESIAIALANVFGIPPENLQTQGYGERYLKVNTEEPEELNRRVTIRRITPLVQQAEAQ